jgi:hypothetical protein
VRVQSLNVSKDFSSFFGAFGINRIQKFLEIILRFGARLIQSRSSTAPAPNSQSKWEPRLGSIFTQEVGEKLYFAFF